MLNIVFMESNSFISRVIRLFTGGRVTHTALQIGKDVYIHADAGGVQLSTLNEMLGKDRKITAVYSAKPHVEVKFDMHSAMKMLGRKYDYDGLLGFIPAIISRKIFGIKIKNPFADPHEYVCSEFVCSSEIWKKKHEIPEFSRVDPELISPNDLLRRIKIGRSFYRVV